MLRLFQIETLQWALQRPGLRHKHETSGETNAVEGPIKENK